MLDLIGTVALTATLFVVVIVFLNALEISQATRTAAVALIGAWAGLAIALALAGELSDQGRRVVPLIGVLFATPLVVASVIAILSPATRKAVLAAPMSLLIGLHATRVVGGFFLLLALDVRLAGPFPYFAGWGDVITAVVALPIAWVATRAAHDRDWLIGAWNMFGAFDLFLAAALGITSAPGSPLQLFSSEIGSAAVPHFPWSLIPTVLVPLYLIGHGIIFAQLWRRRGHGASAQAARPRRA